MTNKEIGQRLSSLEERIQELSELLREPYRSQYLDPDNVAKQQSKQCEPPKDTEDSKKQEFAKDVRECLEPYMDMVCESPEQREQFVEQMLQMLRHTNPWLRVLRI